MKVTAPKLLLMVPAVALVALLVIPIATAVAAGRSHPSAKRALSGWGQLAPLKKEIKQLQNRISVLERSKRPAPRGAPPVATSRAAVPIPSSGRESCRRPASPRSRSGRQR